jgi:formate-dependent nitrite reductase cytochrome c552 subunit
MPDGPPVVNTGSVDAAGRPVTISCGTCHTTNAPNPQARLGTDLTRFHQGLKSAHGNLACVACHNPAEGYGSLRLADGASLPYPEVMQLCAQCHGPQYRDYQHGSHGGMTGHWDLTRGGRLRNNCVDCHDPHAPKYPTVRPADGPRDRGGAHPDASEPRKGAGHE